MWSNQELSLSSLLSRGAERRMSNIYQSGGRQEIVKLNKSLTEMTSLLGQALKSSHVFQAEANGSPVEEGYC